MTRNLRSLSTTRLDLEPVTQAHAAPLFEAMRDPLLYRYEPRKPPQTLESVRARFALWEERQSFDGASHWLNWAVRRRDDDVYLGLVQATVSAGLATIGYTIFTPFWRMGYGKEAVGAIVAEIRDSYETPLVQAWVDVENAASIALLESLGFERVWTGPSEDQPGRTDHRYERRF